jgi:hypothetical protein
MPWIQKLKPSAKQDRPKVTKSPPPGATNRGGKIKLTRRDPRRKGG